MTPEAIKSFRERLEWSQQQLAEELGVDQATVSRMENGVEPRGPVRRLLERLIADHSDQAGAAA
jgi:transcriptional regulator with XRE-family HTH domain